MLQEGYSFRGATATDSDGQIAISLGRCPACNKTIAALMSSHGKLKSNQWVWPATTYRAPLHPAVPAAIAADFREAAMVLQFSPKASAALSRRCLQSVLTGEGFKQHNLVDQINAALPTLPDHLKRDLDAVRQIGNFAAHEMKDKHSGVILDVEDGEAEWSLEVLEELFQHYYVGPAESLKRSAALSAKLQAAGKPPLKK